MSTMETGEDFFRPPENNKPNNERNLYEILEVSQNASLAEIRTSYFKKKKLLKESAATYSLFENQTTNPIESEIEQSYLTLSDEFLRQQYDEAQSNKGPHRDNQRKSIRKRPTPPPSRTMYKDLEDSTRQKINEAMGPNQDQLGKFLKMARKECNISTEELYRNLKISASFIHALEEEDFNNLPPVVYVRGFLKSLLAYLGIKNEPQVIDQYSRKIENWKQKTAKKR